MKALKLIGVLLDYPSEPLWENGAELVAATADPALSPQRQQQLAGFVRELLAVDTMTAQERWLGMFDRGRSMSLLLFEHIHGESRDRGQAMVDLLATYLRNGYELARRELPDYLPLVLEYLSQRPEEEAIEWLGHVRQILELLAARSAERESPYAVLFQTLIEISHGEADLAVLRKRVAGEERDDTPEAMDRVWEEEAVRFGPEAPGRNCAPPARPGDAAQPTSR